jgi:hypothetical protein
VYGVHGAITGSLPPQCDFKLGNLELEKHTFLALSVSIKLIDSSLLQLKKCYYFTFMPQDSMHLMEEVSGPGSRNYYLFGFFLPQGETVQKFLAQPSRQAAVKFFCLLLFEGTFTSFFNDKKSKRSNETVRIKVFLLFLLDNRRIRIQEAQKHTDPTDLDSDPDPQLWQAGT